MPNYTNKTHFFLQDYTQISEPLAINIIERMGGEEELINCCEYVAREGINKCAPSFEWGQDVAAFYESNKEPMMRFLDNEADIIGYPSKMALINYIKRIDGSLSADIIKDTLANSESPYYQQVTSAITWYVAETLCIDYANFSNIENDNFFSNFLESYTDMERSLILSITDQLGGHTQFKDVYSDISDDGLMGHIGFIAFDDILSLYDKNKAEFLDFLDHEATEFRLPSASDFVKQLNCFSRTGYSVEVIEDALHNNASEHRKEVLSKVVKFVVETLCSEFSNFVEIYQDETTV